MPKPKTNYMLKPGQPGFRVADGKDKGLLFSPGKKYKSVPKEYRKCFKIIKPPALPVEKIKEPEGQDG